LPTDSRKWKRVIIFSCNRSCSPDSVEAKTQWHRRRKIAGRCDFRNSTKIVCSKL